MEFEVKILDEAGLLEFQGGAPKKTAIASPTRISRLRLSW